ncbi:MAG: glycosyltransferase family 2 protein [Algoriphagus sp.]|nr:glycosyltransferase family 2 protein [Algoriphagus sp.]
MEYLGTRKEINQVIPMVSVCVQTYQHEAYIRECLDSILSQKTTFPFEIILGEDDSEDGTREICKEYADKHPDVIRLFLRDKKDKIFINGTKTGRFNFLENLKSCRGKYISFCDGDDYWVDSEKIQKQVEFLESNPEIFLCYTGNFQENPEQNTTKEEVENEKIFQPAEIKRINYLGHISNWMIKNHLESLISNPIVNKAPVMDVVLFEYSKMQGKVAALPFFSSFYRFNPSGLYRMKSEKTVHKDRLILSYYLFRYIHKNPITFLRGLGYYSSRYYFRFWKDKPLF